MAVAMAKSNEPTISFPAPAISDKHYIVQGPSGWPETFKRAEADEALRQLVSPIPVEELVAVFVAQRELAEGARKVTDWHTIIGFIARMLSIHPRDVPPVAGVAFWGRVILAMVGRGAN